MHKILLQCKFLSAVSYCLRRCPTKTPRTNTPLFSAVRGSVGVRTPPRGSDRVRSTGYCQFSTKIPAGFCLTMSYAKKSPFSRTAAHIFLSPGDALATITQYVAWKERQFNACQTPRSMYLSVFNSFPVIRTASAKTRRFHVPQPTFLFPLETPLRLSRNILHGWKDNSMLAKRLAACTYLPSIVSELYDA